MYKRQGKFDVTFLQASDDFTQTVANKQKPTPDLTHEAQKARDSLRYAESLQRKKSAGRKIFSRLQEAKLEDLAAGKLHAAANEATRKSGWGRIKHRDGTFEDIAPHNGGIVRTVLDKVDPASSADEYQSLDEDSS